MSNFSDQGHSEISGPFFTTAIFSCVAGWYYHQAPVFPGAYIHLVRDPENLHDPNAVAVHNHLGERIGFVPRGLAAVLAPLVDGNRC